MYSNQPLRRVNRPQLVRSSRYELKPATALEIVDRVFDRIERAPLVAAHEYRRFIWKKRLEGALFLLLVLILIYVLNNPLHTWEPLLSSPVMPRLEASKQGKQEGMKPSQPRTKASS